MRNIRVGIADDHNLFREGIRMILSEMKGISLTLEATSGEDLLEQLARTLVDVVLLDIEMKKMMGIETLKNIRSFHPHLKVVILSMHTEPQMISYLMELGANGYLQKDARKDELEDAICTVHEKGFFFNDRTSNSLLTSLKSKGKRTSTLTVEISPREREVLNLICQEFTMQEIGEKLFISERTVEGHRKNLFTKLDAKNTAGLVKKAVLLQLID